MQGCHIGEYSLYSNTLVGFVDCEATKVAAYRHNG